MGRFPQNSQAAQERKKNQKRKNGCYDSLYSFVLKSPTENYKGMLWPQAMAGVVGYPRHPTTPRWLLPREGFSSQAFTPSLSKEGTVLGAPLTYLVPYSFT